jgi:hypothetical protein
MYFVAATRFPFSLETHLVLITGKFPALISKKKSVCPTFLQRIPHFLNAAFQVRAFMFMITFALCFTTEN